MSGAPAHFATRFILAAGEALMRAGFEPAEVSPQRVVYRCGQVLLAAHWDDRAGIPVIRLGHQRGGPGNRVDLGAGYNDLLAVAGLAERTPTAPGADPASDLAAAARVLDATLDAVVAQLPVLEGRARLGALRGGQDEFEVPS